MGTWSVVWRAISTSLLGEYSASALELFMDFLKEKQSFIITKKDTTKKDRHELNEKEPDKHVYKSY